VPRVDLSSAGIDVTEGRQGSTTVKVRIELANVEAQAQRRRLRSTGGFGAGSHS
jgi:hypothetical protein